MSDSQVGHGIVEYLKYRSLPVNSVQVEVVNGVAVVRGVASSDFVKQVCVACCRRVAGVVRVVDEVRVAGA